MLNAHYQLLFQPTPLPLPILILILDIVWVGKGVVGKGADSIP